MTTDNTFNQMMCAERLAEAFRIQNAYVRNPQDFDTWLDGRIDHLLKGLEGTL